MNASDIKAKTFVNEKNGYSCEEVDEFLKNLSLEFAQLQSEKEELEGKIGILADKVREYRSDEEALKDAMLSAQKEKHRVLNETEAKIKQMLDKAQKDAEAVRAEANKYSEDSKQLSDGLVEEAEKEAKRLDEEAKATYQKMMGEAKQKYDAYNETAQKAYEQNVERINKAVEAEETRLTVVRHSVSDFKQELLSMYRSQLELVVELPDFDEEEEPEAPEAEKQSDKNAQKPADSAKPVNNNGNKYS